MKRLLFLFFFMNITMHSQWKNEYSQEVNEFMEIVESKYQTLNSMSDNISLTTNELKTIIVKMYRAIAKDPEGYDKYIVDRHLELEKKLKENTVNPNTPKYGWTIKLMQDKIAEIYSDKFVQIIIIPYFFRVKVTRISPEIYYLKEGGTRNTTVLEGKIEDVIKGEKKYKVGDTISFTLMNHLTSPGFNIFENGSSYFIPFRFEKEFPLFVQFLKDTDYSHKKEDEISSLPINVFEITDENKWENFKSIFKQKYLIEE